MISLRLLVESALDETVLRRLLTETGRYDIDACSTMGGKAKLKKAAPKYNAAALLYPYFLLVDLDNDECPPGLIEEWLPHGRSPNLVFRVAVHEVEAWLLADKTGLSEFLQVSAAVFPRTLPDQISDPKRTLIEIARRSRSRQIREAIVPGPESTSRVGKDYNGILSQFVFRYWSIDAAIKNSPSLYRAYQSFVQFDPVYPET